MVGGVAGVAAVGAGSIVVYKKVQNKKKYTPEVCYWCIIVLMAVVVGDGVMYCIDIYTV